MTKAETMTEHRSQSEIHCLVKKNWERPESSEALILGL